MKKSCSGKESKLFNSGVDKTIVNECEGVKKDDHLDGVRRRKGGLERDIVNSGENTTASKGADNLIHPASEKLHKVSPKVTKSTGGGRWIDNSFEDQKKSVNCGQTEECHLSKPVKRKSNRTSANPEVEGVLQQSNSINQVQKSSNNNLETQKSLKKSHLSKANAEDRCQEKYRISVQDGCASAGSEGSFLLGKKRASPAHKRLDSSKKLKMEEANNNAGSNNNNNNDNHHSEEDREKMNLSNSINNNNCSSSSGSSSGSGSGGSNNELPLCGGGDDEVLKFEHELEKRRKSVQVNRRDIKTIVAECELRNEKWRETFSKYKCPAQWGLPIVRNCNEKWDGSDIPHELLVRFQKFLLARNMTHPVFLPANSDSGLDLMKSSEVMMRASASNETDDDGDGGAGDNFRDINADSDGYGQSNVIESGKSSLITENGERMVLRTRNQYKPVVVEDDEISSDDSDDWMNKQRPGRKGRGTPKSKKNSVLNNQQLVLKLEKCNINKKNGNGDRRMDRDNFLVGNSLNHDVSKPALPEPETMVCPICSLRFSKQLIESHATECASKTYKD